MENENNLSQDLIERMIKDKKVRIAITKQSHNLFFHFYFAHYVKYKTAEFQNEIFDLTENETYGNIFIVAFRGCGKSTIVTTSYPIWSILGQQQKKFVLILCQTQSQAKQHMMNMRRELENNVVLKNDLGPFKEESDEWGSSSLVFSLMNARVTVASTEQSIRGLRHNQHRPDLIICDDIENIASTKTREGRNKTYEWLTGEVIPTGDRNTRLIIVGNLLHEDSLLMRIKEDIQNNKIDGIFKEYPLIQNGQIMWVGKYPTLAEIELEKRKAGNEYAWQREYLLKILPHEEKVIHREWIRFYHDLPERKDSDYQGMYIGVDLAISEKKTADYTAMVMAYIYGSGKNTQIYILPQIVNQKMNFPDTVRMCKDIYSSYHSSYTMPNFVIEEVAYQSALSQQLRNEGLPCIHSFKPGSGDKRSRLAITANYIKEGKIIFPEKGCEKLLDQLVNFGVEKHDDLADAFSTLILHYINNPPRIPRIRLL